MHRPTLCGALLALVSFGQPVIEASGEHRVSRSSLDGVLGAVKPTQGAVVPEDLAMWRSQSAALVGSAVGVGDEKRWHYRGEPARIVALRLPLATGCADGPFGFIVGVLDAKG